MASIRNNQQSDFFDSYRMMASFSDIITEHQAKGTIRAAWLSELNPEITKRNLFWETIRSLLILPKLSGLGHRRKLKTQSNGMFGPRGKKGYAMVLLMGDNEYLVMGANAQVTFAPANGEGITAFSKVNEGIF